MRKGGGKVWNLNAHHQNHGAPRPGPAKLGPGVLTGHRHTGQEAEQGGPLGPGDRPLVGPAAASPPPGRSEGRAPSSPTPGTRTRAQKPAACRRACLWPSWERNRCASDSCALGGLSRGRRASFYAAASGRRAGVRPAQQSGAACSEGPRGSPAENRRLRAAFPNRLTTSESCRRPYI